MKFERRGIVEEDCSVVLIEVCVCIVDMKVCVEVRSVALGDME